MFTKSFSLNDYKENLGLENVSFLPHGCDSMVHREFTAEFNHNWLNDVSFIGAWSNHKERILSSLKMSLPEINLKIWGNGWQNNQSECLNSSIIGYPVFGDLYALAINSSKINLGLLQEKASGASSGDVTTARTFHIPSSGGFMLHERTDEVLNFYQENIEIECFSTDIELVNKVKYFLENDTKRKLIAKLGNKRCLEENKHFHRAEIMIKEYEKRSK